MFSVLTDLAIVASAKSTSHVSVSLLTLMHTLKFCYCSNFIASRPTYNARLRIARRLFNCMLLLLLCGAACALISADREAAQIAQEVSADDCGLFLF